MVKRRPASRTQPVPEPPAQDPTHALARRARRGRPQPNLEDLMGTSLGQWAAGDSLLGSVFEACHFRMVSGGGVTGCLRDGQAEEVGEAARVASGGDRFVEDA